MKFIFNKAILLFIAGILFASCSRSPVKLEFAVIDSVYNVGGVEYNADYCKMQILENPNDKGSKVIDIPVIRIRTSSKDPGSPVFILNDGPGYSNFETEMPTWLAENHDVVIIGYRGVDGSVNLNIPELNLISQNPNFLSESNLELAGKAIEKSFKKFSDSLDIDINQYNIYNIAYDIESARLAFQYQKINLYAVGYGAGIAQIYSKISPSSIFRVFMERPKPYGSLALEPKYIENVLEFYDNEAKSINNNTGFSKNIIMTLEKLPSQNNGQTFDKDKIIYSAYKTMETDFGAAMVNEAFLSARNGDFESLKFLEESYSNLYPAFNLGDYIIKSVTSDFNPQKNYIKDFSYNKDFSFGSPLAKFIYGSVQKSSFRPEIISKKLINPDSLAGQCLMVMANLDISAPYEIPEFNLKSKYLRGESIILSDFTQYDVRHYKTQNYSNLIAEFLYVGNSKSFNQEMKTINLKPDKTFKQIALERIQ